MAISRRKLNHKTYSLWVESRDGDMMKVYDNLTKDRALAMYNGFVGMNVMIVKETRKIVKDTKWKLSQAPTLPSI